MAFQFPLATVLRLKESIEKREERALQQINLEIARIKAQIDELTRQIAAARQAREQALRTVVPASHLHAMLHEEQAAEQRKQGLMGTLQTLGEQRDKQIKVYQAAHRDHETILSLFNNLRSTYEQEQTANRAEISGRYLYGQTSSKLGCQG